MLRTPPPSAKAEQPASRSARPGPRWPLQVHHLSTDSWSTLSRLGGAGSLHLGLHRENDSHRVIGRVLGFFFVCLFFGYIFRNTATLGKPVSVSTVRPPLASLCLRRTVKFPRLSFFHCVFCTDFCGNTGSPPRIPTARVGMQSNARFLLV